MELTPLNDYLIIEVKQEEEIKTSAGIILPDSVDIEQPDLGKVYKIGVDVKTKQVAVGDTVLFKKHLFDEIKHEGKHLYFGKETNLFAVVK